jgi:methyl-accepting chemotaxis protein
MRIANMKIGARLATGFGLVMLLMAALLIIGLTRLTGIASITDKIIEKEWVKVEAANTINALTRANAQRTMELFIATDKEEVSKIYQGIDGNKKRITEALGTLDGIITSDAGKQLMGRIKEARAAYVASFTKTTKLLEDNKREEAIAVMHGETLPALDVLLSPIKELVEREKRFVEDGGEEARQNIASARIWMIATGLAGLLLSIGFAWLITRSITRPLNAAVKIAQTVAAGDLTSRIEETSTDETGQLLHALRGMNESLVRIVSEVRTGTATIATASSQIASGNLDLSSRTEEQASSLEETASSMEELTSTVKQNADNARQANLLAVSASEVAVKGGAIVSSVVETMGSINESARKIVDIIGVIDGIAFQTNILALNAAVEAARAGEQGRGFAVVASEVRNLAQRSAAAAKEIKTLIGDSVDKVDAGSKLVDQAGATMGEIVAGIRHVTDIMGEITAASHEQSDGIEQINQAIGQMDEVTQQNAALVEQAAAAAGSLQEQAGNLMNAVSIFKLNGMQTVDALPAANVLRLAKKKPPMSNAIPEISIHSQPVKRVANGSTASGGDWEEF